MPYLIDGHNLIPKVGLRLDSLDDEQALVELLADFCRSEGAQAEVYFDGAPAGQAVVRRRGRVTAHYIRVGSSADAAIEARLGRLGKQARNWSVVSSDGRVQAAGRAAHAQVVSGEEFGTKMRSMAKRVRKEKREGEISPEEVDEWLSLFRNRKG